MSAAALLFAGNVSVPVLMDQSVLSSGVPNQTAMLQLNLSGALETQITGGSVTPVSGEWLVPATGMSGFECLATIVSGSVSTGTTGSWLDLASTQQWTRVRNTSGTSTVVFTLAIRQKTTTTNLTSATMTLEADKA